MSSAQLALLSDSVVFSDGVRKACIRVEGGKVVGIHDDLPPGFEGVIEDHSGQVIMPGLVDSHVHVNEPGRTEWEGFETATQAAAAGGITTLVDMPLNCIPVTTSAANFKKKLEAVEGLLWIDAGFWGGVTPESMADLDELLKAGVLGVKSFLIDSGIDEFRPMTEEALRPAMRALARAGLPYLFHAELESPAPLANANTYSEFVKTRPASWENSAVRLLIELSRETGCRTHIVHLSSAEVIDDLKKAKKAGVPITAETCPHYLLLDERAIDQTQDPASLGLFKCCPPIRSLENSRLLWQALRDGVLDAVVSDHSPCTAGLKCLDSGDLAKAWGGISSLQFGLPLIWTQSSSQGIGLTEVARWMCEGPAKLAGLFAQKGSIAIGKDADLVIFDPKAERKLSDQEILYKNKLSPYLGRSVRGRVRKTFLRGQVCYENGKPSSMPLGRPLLNHPGQKQTQRTAR